MGLPVVQLLELAHVRPREVNGQQEVHPQRSEVQKGGEESPQLQLEHRRLPVEEQGTRPLVVVENPRDDGEADAHLHTGIDWRGRVRHEARREPSN